ncbi:hypothetical protein EV383_3609 [Pseudonocardia sediminis]|uniref:DUF7064 domain-containing protein n=1 Tax=Pseudonocardia sediminis TaxID=1397368 RepID=A0A4Q7UXG5_PSEST|nr:hypothetical protein [Pseudonocardia sediminis]RZT86712.1 hypothetical protein EV383_3609 [Pseudonocardia sediminis]
MAFSPKDDLRHRPVPGKKMRDSLFWEMIMPDEQLGLQIYVYLTDRGRTGYNVAVWGPGEEPLALELGGGTVEDSADLDDFTFEGLHVRQPEFQRTAEVRYSRGDVEVEYSFEGIHDAFSFRSNPDGLPSWFAENRMEQTGRVSGFLQVGDRRVEWDRRIAHRDHSWGARNWAVPHHWKWIVAYTDSGRAVNAWIWIAKGEWGFAGYVLTDGVTVPISHVESRATYDDDMTQRHLDADVVTVDGARTRLVLDRYALVKLPTNARSETEIWEAACHATIDGEPGAAQFETHWPSSYLQHLIEAGG